MPQSWVQKQQQLGPNFQHPEGREKRVSREKIIRRRGKNSKREFVEKEKRQREGTNYLFLLWVYQDNVRY
ncbi:hypothetical protein KUCAC02_001138 [Chaenocephalus aceratus]|uniref:Uncharacterized protein n=1 Tax=Chaenocephalus aceratus TaxID=36190 RepID=A0ACB9XVG5_CHAAC|nr:hypothetical protein KUCAC02_001138 [Chaenocephalus aceratus]